MARFDPHSHADDAQPKVVSLDWSARVDFASHTLEAIATLTLGDGSGPSAPTALPGPLDLDTRGLSIDSVEDDRGRAVAFTLHDEEPIVGARLALHLDAGTRAVTIRYRTSPDASALQWLDPEQTAGGAEPFLFSQCQAIHARSVVPLQDTPARRITFTASLDVPRALRGLVGAGFVERVEQGDRAIERWSMPQAIPPYLIAFAVGQLESRRIGRISQVWAEPSVVERAAWEFAEVDTMLDAAERLFGPYVWETYDVLVMPPSFPYGGMENPRLTFVTPTLLAGDRSQVGVIGHELAHAWTGNLVTNATAEHFWLNEGWTRYAELRIVEEHAGEAVASLERALCRSVLDETIARFSREGRGALTRLRTNLWGVDPDESFSVVPYDKGALLLTAIEEHVGRERFDRFTRAYIDRFRFQSIDTDQFVAFTETELPGVLEAVGARAWIDGEGLPSNAPSIVSTRLSAIEAIGVNVPAPDALRSPLEWSVWLERLPRPQSAAFCAELDARHGLSRVGNLEVKIPWLRLAIASSYDAALPEVERVLGEVGRMKYSRPLYAELAQRPDLRERARALFSRLEPGYHPIARAVVRGLLEKAR